MYDVVIIGGGAGGQAVAHSIECRRPGLKIAVIEPASSIAYQPAWTLVGGGAFDVKKSTKPTARVMARFVTWIKDAVVEVLPDDNQVVLTSGERLTYSVLITCPGLVLNWQAIEGLEETLGKNGVTSNYRIDLAPYTWELVQNLRSGVALFTQPPMPIKCAGAPQKAVYLSSSYWEKQGLLSHIQVKFHNAGAVLFGVEYFVPPLEAYMRRYGVQLQFNSTLVRVDGPQKIAYFKSVGPDGEEHIEEVGFDLLHVVPPQKAPDFIAKSPLANAAGWVDVHPNTMQHVKYKNVFAVGDVSGTANAKTAAAVRNQAPVVAINVIAHLEGRRPTAAYSGYGACPLTVEHGKIVLAEFAYNGQLEPTFPFLEPNVPRRLYWFLKRWILPAVYWHGLMRGREWLLKTRALNDS